MLTAIIITALIIVLFLLWILIWTKKTNDEVQEVYAVLARLAENLKISQQNEKEAQQKLYDYMDFTRKESLDSYRRGLQDGILAAEQKPAYAPQNPVKTMAEHVEDKQESAEAKQANKVFEDGFNAIMNYTGDLPKGE